MDGEEAIMDSQEHELHIIIEPEIGVLDRVIGLFTAAGCSIESCSLGISGRPNASILVMRFSSTLSFATRTLGRIQQFVGVLQVLDFLNIEETNAPRSLVFIKFFTSRNWEKDLLHGLKNTLPQIKFADVGRRTMTIQACVTPAELIYLRNRTWSLRVMETVRTPFIRMRSLSDESSTRPLYR